VLSAAEPYSKLMAGYINTFSKSFTIIITSPYYPSGFEKSLNISANFASLSDFF
jgi:hypothetical protein